MRSTSRIAPRALIAGIVGLGLAASLGSAQAGDDPPPVVENTVRLELMIAGLGAQGARIEIKPAHPGCQFPTVTKSIPKGRAEIVKLPPIAIDARSTGVDRDCTFEITLTEPGQKPKTFLRGLQLTAARPGEKTPTKSLQCRLPATSVASRDDAKIKERR